MSPVSKMKDATDQCSCEHVYLYNIITYVGGNGGGCAHQGACIRRQCFVIDFVGHNVQSIGDAKIWVKETKVEAEDKDTRLLGNKSRRTHQSHLKLFVGKSELEPQQISERVTHPAEASTAPFLEYMYLISSRDKTASQCRCEKTGFHLPVAEFRVLHGYEGYSAPKNKIQYVKTRSV